MARKANIQVGTRTPWGKAQDARQVFPGVYEVSTAGHGGYKVLDNALIPECLRKAGGWYEEDCEWAIVAFSLGFGDIGQARATLKDYYPDQFAALTGEIVPLAESRVLRERAFERDNAERYVVTCAFGSWHERVPAGFVGVEATLGGKREGNAPRTYWLVPEHEYDSRRGPYVVTDAATRLEGSL